MYGGADVDITVIDITIAVIAVDAEIIAIFIVHSQQLIDTLDNHRLYYPSYQSALK